MTESLEQRFLAAFPHFKASSSALLHGLLHASAITRAPAGTPLESEGQFCSELVFLLAGDKRIYKRSSTGREITLYEIGPGEICMLNASCILANSQLPANADALSDLTMLSLPAADFLRMMREHAGLRAFVFGRINQGIAAVMSLITEVTFRRTDERLSRYLLEHSKGGVVGTTHQKIADTLGTSREVVSRLLKAFEKRGLVRLSRTRIHIERLAQ